MNILVHDVNYNDKTTTVQTSAINGNEVCIEE